MEVAVRYFEFDKAQCDKLLITEDPPRCFRLSKWHMTSVCQGLSLFALGEGGGGKMTGPGNEVERLCVLWKRRGLVDRVLDW